MWFYFYGLFTRQSGPCRVASDDFLVVHTRDDFAALHGTTPYTHSSPGTPINMPWLGGMQTGRGASVVSSMTAFLCDDFTLSSAAYSSSLHLSYVLIGVFVMYGHCELFCLFPVINFWKFTHHLNLGNNFASFAHFNTVHTNKLAKPSSMATTRDDQVYLIS